MSTQVSALIIILLFIAAGVVAWQLGWRLRDRGYRFGKDTLVRCQDGHVFTTVWIPFASFNAIKLGWVRFQYCPVGEHWTFVTLVRDPRLR